MKQRIVDFTYFYILHFFLLRQLKLLQCHTSSLQNTSNALPYVASVLAAKMLLILQHHSSPQRALLAPLRYLEFHPGHLIFITMYDHCPLEGARSSVPFWVLYQPCTFLGTTHATHSHTRTNVKLLETDTMSGTDSGMGPPTGKLGVSAELSLAMIAGPSLQ